MSSDTDAREDGDAEMQRPGVDSPETKTTECWRCGKQRYIFESCPHCGGSCKPLTKKKQQDGWEKEGFDER